LRCEYFEQVRQGHFWRTAFEVHIVQLCHFDRKTLVFIVLDIHFHIFGGELVNQRHQRLVAFGAFCNEAYIAWQIDVDCRNSTHGR